MENLMFGLEIMVIGMGIVFTVFIVLMYAIKALAAFSNSLEKKSAE